MSRVGWGALLRQVLRRETGWRPLLIAVALGFALTMLAFGLAGRVARHMHEMAAVPEAARLQVRVAMHDVSGRRHSVEADLAAIRAVPGVTSASWFEAPLRSTWWRPEIFQAGPTQLVGWSVVTDEAAEETLALHLVDGRFLTREDGQPSVAVPVVVTETFLRESRAHLGSVVRSVERAAGARIVGVVEDFLSHGQMKTSRNTVLWPRRQEPGASGLYLVRVEEDELPRVRDTLERALGASGRLVVAERVADAMAETHAMAHRAARVLYTLVAALVLTVLLGTVAVCAFRVVERRRQLGLLRAVGATRLDVALLVVSESLLTTIIGVGLGLGIAAACLPLLTRLVPFLAITPGMVGTGSLLYVGASVLAALLPAIEASRVPPSVASRGS